MTLHGTLSHESGDGRVRLLFVERGGAAPPRELVAGDRLTVFEPEGSVRWSGTIGGVERTWIERVRRASPPPFWHPRGMLARRWLSAFDADPPLRAELRPATAPRA